MPRLSPLVYALLIPACQTTVNLTEGTETATENSTVDATNGTNSTNNVTEGVTTGNCTEGAEGCSCYGNNTCNDKLVCSMKNLCEQSPGEMTGDSTSTTSGSGPTTTAEGTADTTSGMTSDTGSEEGLDGWSRYREVLIDNDLPGDLTDFQVHVDVDYDSDMAADFADLRFTDEFGTMTLPYWIEFDTAPVNAYVWVRVPVIAAESITTLRMYYGNPNAAAGSDGPATFLFFDDFEAAELDASKWKTTAPIQIDFGRLKVFSGVVYSTKAVADFPGTWAEARMEWHPENVNPNPYPSGFMASESQSVGPNLQYYNRQATHGIVFDGQNILAEPMLEGGMGTTFIAGIAADDTDTYFSYNRGFPASPSAALSFSYFLLFGHGYGKTGGMENVGDVDIDWVLVRRHAETDPLTFIGGEQNP